MSLLHPIQKPCPHCGRPMKLVRDEAARGGERYVQLGSLSGRSHRWPARFGESARLHEVLLDLYTKRFSLQIEVAPVTRILAN